MKSSPHNEAKQRRAIYAVRKAGEVAKEAARFRDGKGRDRVEESRKKTKKKTKA